MKYLFLLTMATLILTSKTDTLYAQLPIRTQQNDDWLEKIDGINIALDAAAAASSIIELADKIMSTDNRLLTNAADTVYVVRTSSGIHVTVYNFYRSNGNAILVTQPIEKPRLKSICYIFQYEDWDWSYSPWADPATVCTGPSLDCSQKESFIRNEFQSLVNMLEH